MRPIKRGENPTNNNKSIIFKKYRDAAPYLKHNLGKYCSYCEMKFPNTHIEHIQPKSLEKSLETTWNNFLLACPYCNGIKKDKPINQSNLSDYFWPDQDNTFIPFVYEKDRAPQVSAQLSSELKSIAQNTLSLTGLDREPNHANFNIKSDERWHERLIAWGKAERAKQNWLRHSNDAMLEQIIDTATSTGFWSVWMTVFHDTLNIRQRLIDSFSGTCTACFDDNTQPIQRPDGQI